MKRGTCPRFLSHLAECLAPESARRIAHLEWMPANQRTRKTTSGTFDVDARGIAGVTHEQSEYNDEYCFSLLIQLESEMEQYLNGHSFDCFKAPGPFGCMWTSVRAGEQFILLTLTAATSGMSRVLRDSNVIHQLWKGFAQKVNATIAYVEMEEEPASVVFPNTGELILPNEDGISYFENDYEFSIDRYANMILRQF